MDLATAWEAWQILEYRIGAVGNGAVPPARFPGTMNDATMAALPSHRATVPAIDFDDGAADKDAFVAVKQYMLGRLELRKQLTYPQHLLAARWLHPSLTAAERGVFHEGLAAVLSFVHEYPALPGRGDPDQAASEARAIAMRDNSLPGLSTRGAVFRVQNSLEYWSTLVKLTGYAKDLGVSNLADYGMRLAGALVVEADMERKFKPVAKMQNGDRNRTSLVTAERHMLCSVMLQYDGIGNTLWDNDGAFDLKPTSVSSLWDGFTELDDESERADDVRWVREVFAGGNESAKDDDDGDAGAIDDTDLTV